MKIQMNRQTMKKSAPDQVIDSEKEYHMMKKNKKILIPVIAVLVIVCVIAMVFIAKKYKPNKEVMSLEEYFQVPENQIQIILQDEIYDTKGLYSDGQIYVDVDLVKKYLNSRFYWDAKENLLLYTTPNAVISASTGSKDYFTDRKSVV